MKRTRATQVSGSICAPATSLSGIDIVPDVVRLCAMNMYLHGIAGVETMIEQQDAL